MKAENPVAGAIAKRAAHLADVTELKDPGTCRIQIPAFILKSLEESLRSGETHYTVRPGMPELRERIAQEISLSGGPRYDSIDSVLITNGDSESLFVTLLGLKLHTGEVVVAPDQIRQQPLFEFFDLRSIPASQPMAPTPNIRLVYRERESSPAVQKALVQFTHDQAVPDFLNLGDVLASSRKLKIPPVSTRHSLLAGTLNSLPGIPVFRVGYLLGPEAYMSRIRVWKQALSICSAAPSQRAALTALTSWQEKH